LEHRRDDDNGARRGTERPPTGGRKIALRHSTGGRECAISLHRMDIELREITAHTVRDICALEVAEDQRNFVAPNAVSIAEAHFEPQHWMRAIYADGRPVGFVLAWEPGGTAFLWRFMIAEPDQGKGIGRRAMELVIEHWREAGATAAKTSVVPGNAGATALYEAVGFALTGDTDSGELVMARAL